MQTTAHSARITAALLADHEVRDLREIGEADDVTVRHTPAGVNDHGESYPERWEVFVGGWRVGVYKTEAGAQRRVVRETCSYSTVYGGEQWCDTHDPAYPCAVAR